MLYFDKYFNPLTNWCLSTRSDVTVELFRKIKACLMLWFATAIFMWGYVLLSYFGFSESGAYKGGFMFSLGHFIVPYLFRKSISIAKIGMFISFTGLAWQFWFCYYSGGVYSPAAVWFTIHPVILGFFGNARLVLLSVTLNIAVIGSLYYLEVVGSLPVSQLGETFADLMIISTFIGIDILIAAFTLMAVSMNKKQNEEISEAKDHIENLIKILSHDIANPLTVMKIILDSTENSKEPLSDRKLVLMKNAYKDIEVLTNSVKEWLANTTYQFAKIDDVISFQDIQDHINQNFSERVKEKNLKIVFSLESKISSFKSNKMILLNNVLNNLISNAIKFSYENKTIFVSLKDSEKGLEITVTDEGTGIPENVLADVFNPSLQTTSSGTNGESGTGFGLPIAKKMIKQINGDLELESQVFTESTESYGTRATIMLVIM
jgi:signal transduction histidine kinase